MFTSLKKKIYALLVDWQIQIQKKTQLSDLDRNDLPILISIYSKLKDEVENLLQIGLKFQVQGYPVSFIGNNATSLIVRRYDFMHYSVEDFDNTLPSIRRHIEKIQDIIHKQRPALLITTANRPASISAKLEGIDLLEIDSAVNQPAYPYPIRTLDGFPEPVDALQEYLEQRAEEFKPQTTLTAFRDIPEFHPLAGLSVEQAFVGPLLADANSPPGVDRSFVQASDKSLPLVVVGVPEKAPFIDSLIAVAAELPCRWLIQIQSGKTMPSLANLRSFTGPLSGDILRHADFFAGNGSHDKVYQCLREGIPLIGFPRTLEEEYHLNRLQQLGLGQKIDRADFDPRRVTETIRKLSPACPELKERCRNFAEQLRKWDAPQRIVEMVDRYFARRQWPYRFDARYALEESEFIAYLEESTPPELSRPEIEQMLAQGRKAGIPHLRQARSIFYDRIDAWNWLYDCEPVFFEADYRALRKKWNYFLKEENGRIHSRRAQQRYRLTYRYSLVVPASCPKEGQCFLPYPIPTASQRDIILISTTPASLKEYLLPSHGFFYGYPVSELVPGERMEWEYVCELTVRHRDRVDAAEVDLVPYLEVPAEIQRLPELREFRASLELDNPGLTPYDKARRIYDTLIHSRRFKKTKDPNQSLSYSLQAVLRDCGGHCITLSNAYIALCRLEGIPARPVTGAHAIYPTRPGRFESKAYREPIFGHTWVEIYVEKGWLPVEFMGVVIGRQAMTECNVQDEELRNWASAHQDGYFDFYFGQVDTSHLECSPSVREIPQFVVGMEDGDSPENALRWGKPAELKDTSHLIFECLE